MSRVADLVEGIGQGTLPVGLECDVDVDSGTSRWVAQTLPVDWSGIPGVLDPHVIPRYDGSREVGEGCDNGEEGKRREPVVSHEYSLRGQRNVRFRSREP
jgi:hypothetical protein